MFQSYALFPHLNVFDNVAFGLRRQHIRRTELRQRVARALEVVRLETLASRRPATLSGGQQQRIALARALVLRPAVLLLDEPLGSLDAKLRADLQVELKSLQEGVGTTFLLVTHDQDEALRMSDRVAVMRAGRIEQIATPQALYEEPATVFVAGFLGTANIMTLDLADGDRLRIGDRSLGIRRAPGPTAGPVTIMVRPERVSLEPYRAVPGDNRLPGMVERVTYGGALLHVIVRVAAGPALLASVPNTEAAKALQQGTPVCAHIPRDAIRVLPDTPPPGP